MLTRQQRHRVRATAPWRLTTLLVLIALTQTNNAAQQRTLQVPQAFATLQQAADAAGSGDTILVGPGTYAGFVSEKPLALQSLQGAERTLISGGVTLRAAALAGVRIQGFTITGSDVCLHFDANTLRQATVSDNIIARCRVGVQMRGAYDDVAILRNQIVSNAEDGVQLLGQGRVRIAENHIAGNGTFENFGVGVRLSGATEGRIEHNTFSDNAFAGVRVGLTSSSRALPLLRDQLLGRPGSARYLILFLNNDEIRPPGGFIGFFAELNVQQEEVTGLTSASVYDASFGLPPEGAAPPPLAAAEVPGWWLRFGHPNAAYFDSNWISDFPTVARQAQWVYEAGGNADGPIDGVIAVDITGAQRLLEQLGPVHVPDYDVWVNADNIRNCIYWRKVSDWQHLAVTLGRDRLLRYYLQGQLVGTRAFTPPDDLRLASLNVGAWLDAGANVSHPMDGWVRSARVYDRALSPEEVAERFRQGTQPPCGPPLQEPFAYWVNLVQEEQPRQADAMALYGAAPADVNGEQVLDFQGQGYASLTFTGAPLSLQAGMTLEAWYRLRPRAHAPAALLQLLPSSLPHGDTLVLMAPDRNGPPALLVAGNGQAQRYEPDPVEPSASAPDQRSYWPDQPEPHKAFGSSLLVALLGRLENLQHDDEFALLDAVYRAMREKHLMIHLNEPQLQQILADLAADGRVEVSAGDYLMVGDADWGGNKSYSLIEKRVSHEVLIQPDHTQVSQTTVRYDYDPEAIHQDPACQRANICQPNYLSFTRLYAPLGSRLLGTHGVRYHLFETVEEGKAMFGHRLVIEQGATTEVGYRYSVPDRIAHLGGDLYAYRLLVQKQPGALGATLDVRVTLPPGAAPVLSEPAPCRLAASTVEFCTTLTTDQAFEILFRHESTPE